MSSFSTGRASVRDGATTANPMPRSSLLSAAMAYAVCAMCGKTMVVRAKVHPSLDAEKTGLALSPSHMLHTQAQVHAHMGQGSSLTESNMAAI